MQTLNEWGSHASKQSVTTQCDRCNVRAVPKVLWGPLEQIGEASGRGKVTPKVRAWRLSEWWYFPPRRVERSDHACA